MTLPWLLGLALLLAPAPGRAEELLVSAAASLTNAFRDLGSAFERTHPGAQVAFNFGASDVLATQIVKGAPADVLAVADHQAMDRAAASGAIARETRRDFAANRLVVIVPRSAPAVPARAEELAAPRYRRLTTGNPVSVPAGRYARQALVQAGQWPALEGRFIFSQNVRQALDYVARGEVDAGIVYATDAATQGDKVRVAFELATPVPVTYPIAAVARSKHPRLARQFVDFVMSAQGQDILARHGFARGN
ncbi:MAG: molybdate ABC transporter substrate-binding protein [Pseudomonadota bacterium]